ncbi:hypothetical protein ASG35_28875 [Burkholderia sp. Leaf177]|nr:hypothetical protein ASG35_28875 [Burkholderia sp. Leaf177]
MLGSYFLTYLFNSQAEPPDEPMIWRSLNILLTGPVSSANITPLTDSQCGVPHASNSEGVECTLHCANACIVEMALNRLVSAVRLRRRTGRALLIHDED